MPLPEVFIFRPLDPDMILLIVQPLKVMQILRSVEEKLPLEQRVMATGNPEIIRTWRSLQTSDHFYYMCTKWFSDGDVHKYFNPYSSPYDAYINYQNVLADFESTLGS